MSFLIESWFWRGTQSAIFYYLSCAPCTTARQQHKQKKAAKQAQLERKATMTEGFQQALPACTNSGWDEEIILGPGPPRKRLSKKELRKRDLLREKLSATISNESDSTTSSTRVGTATTSDTTSGKSMSQGTRSKLSEESMYSRRYQREDEPLWGRDSTGTASPRGISPVARIASHCDSQCYPRDSYYYPRNPIINDYNPPIISNIPRSPAENAWMFQPPPPARVMAGKERPARYH